jgi:hypothetical protein
MNEQAEEPLVDQDELHRTKIKIDVGRSFQKGTDIIREAREYGANAGLTEAEIDELYKQASGEGE